MTLAVKLIEAQNAATAAQAVYGRIALAAEEGTASSSDLSAAFKQLTAAGKRVADLKAAAEAGVLRDQELAAAAEAAEAAERARQCNEVLKELQDVAVQWDSQVEGLVALTHRIIETTDRLYPHQPHAALIAKVEHARRRASAILAHHISFYSPSDGYGSLGGEVMTLASHLPQPE